MSSWRPAPVSLLLLLALSALGCERKAVERERPTAREPAHVPPQASPSVPRPWFQGHWLGPSAQLDIDPTGAVTGRLRSDLEARGLVDEDAVRLEVEGPSGHGVAVLHHEHGRLRGILNYAAPAALTGSREALELSRSEPP